MGIYYESQRGGLCKMHSLNAFFGRPEISENDFSKYKQEYDNFILEKFNADYSEFDMINSDQNTVISYILKYKYNLYTRYFSIGQLYYESKTIDDLFADRPVNDFIFVYNRDHIWGIKIVDGITYNIDSLSGVGNLRNIDYKSCGFIVPLTMSKEMIRNLNIIKNLVPGDIEKYLWDLHKKKMILGDLEIPLSIVVEIMEIAKIPKTEIICQIIQNYKQFLKEFTKGRYNDIDLILKYIPEIILRIRRAA